MAQVTWQGHHDVNGLISQPVHHPHCTQLTRSICYGSVLASYGCCNKSLQTEQLKTNICLLSHGSGGQESHTSLTELKSRCLQGCILFWRLWGREPLSASRGSPPSSVHSAFLHLQSQQQQAEASRGIALTFFQCHISFGLSPASFLYFERPLGLPWSTGMIQGPLNSNMNFICNVNLPLPRDGTHPQAPWMGI